MFVGRHCFPLSALLVFTQSLKGNHAFIDGIGKTRRLIMNLDLIHNGFPVINIEFADRKKYYDAFDVFFHVRSANAMTELILSYVSERLNEYLSIYNDFLQ